MNPREIQEAIAQCLNYLCDHPERQKIVRCQLLAARPVDEEETRSVAVEQGISQVSEELAPVFPGRDEFLEELRQIFRDGVELWLPAQRAKARVMAFPSPEWYYGSHADYGEISDDRRSHVETPLFPQVWDKDNLIYPGFALFSTQRKVIEARDEIERSRSVRDSKNGEHSKHALRQRRASIAHGPPASPALRTVGVFPSPVAGTDSHLQPLIRANAATGARATAQ